MKMLKRKQLDLTCTQIGRKIMLEHSMIYNGGIVENGVWYDGIEVPPPLLPSGTILEPVLIGCGYLQGRFAEYRIKLAYK